MIDLRDRTVIVAGNGQSIADLQPGQVLSTDFIIRTNNFFFEPQYYLGRRVDLAFMGGDPRVAPFMLETLHRCRQDYELDRWSSHNPRVIRAGKRRFGHQFVPMRYRDDDVAKTVADLTAQHQKHPTTGTYAVLMAHGLGATDIILTGIDFYSGPTRYPFEPGPHVRQLMGRDVGTRGIDQRLHSVDLDREILQALAARGDIALHTTAPVPAIDDLVTLAPTRQGPHPERIARPHAPRDWSTRSGLYPISVLKTLRRSSKIVRRVLRRT